MTKIQDVLITTVRLSWREPLNGPPKPHLLRGAIAENFPLEPLFHQHNKDGLVYRYPLIHYRWQNGSGILVGFNEGAKLLARAPFPELTLRLGTDAAIVADAEIICHTASLSVVDRLVRYHFVTPWLPFNQETYRAYHAMDTVSKKSLELDRLAVANILMMLRGLNIEFPTLLYAAIEGKKRVWCQYKDQKLVGILGSLITNIDLPANLAIGKAVSHGFGWIERVR